MSAVDSGLEEQVRKLAAAGLSTRRIAQALGDVSQSTVVRVLQRVNSGPQPVLRAETGMSQRGPAIARTALVAFCVLIGLSFMVLTAAVASLAW